MANSARKLDIDPVASMEADPVSLALAAAKERIKSIPPRKDSLIDRCAQDSWKNWDESDVFAVHSDMESLKTC
ncbi:hypothetical protein [Maritalea sp. S77]|uniref:hypothetical protein n=1 Tax=Maritalea sp. S77 TaxID=3415125 RepID=UPI003C79F9BA